MLAIFLDIETTGLDPLVHNVIDIAFRVVNLENHSHVIDYQSIIKIDDKAWEKRDPVSMSINGYQWNHIQKGKDIQEVFDDIVSIFDRYQIRRKLAVFICQNPAFDRTFFAQVVPINIQEEKQLPYHWLDLASMFFALQMRDAKNKGHPFKDAFLLSKDKIALSLGLEGEPKPHKAMGGVDHLIQCYTSIFSTDKNEIMQ